MSRKKYQGGYEVYEDELGRYRYSDDGSLVPEPKARPCPKCGLSPADFGGHDPCIANLPGVVRACCGHGVKKGVVLFENGVVIKGDFSVGRTDMAEWRRKHGGEE